ncbi:alpha-ketoglutarate-dependent dioxygenase alkB homolog 4-like [Ixodes scapularis]|uniref:alpha-ketoglutarate-dependent dioxygenase alkB homolog 4-like n=1 Tax=Ixodes scapularis TaxID=6945 RepID=UPI001C390216|nr:alpha-ketoglutarate-dependent dioxygenase alkB homolog 4-like [Ixodes scapularis]
MEPKCHCKGVRTCLFCETVKTPSKHAISRKKVRHPFVFCPKCCLCWPGWLSTDAGGGKPCGSVPPLRVPGLEVHEEFLTPDEETRLATDIDTANWAGSQSGRLKQDYGPKVNFKKKKVKSDGFRGLPAYYTRIEGKMRENETVSDFEAVELCNLDYHPKRGSCIDPHYDDWWLWGPRLVTFNLLSDTVLTLSRPEEHWMLTDEDLIESGDRGADDVERLAAAAPLQHGPDCGSWSDAFKDSISTRVPPRLCVVQVPCPRRSMLVLWSDARYKWHHSILREDVKSRRVAMTVRELSEEFLDGGASFEFGAELLSIAKQRI